MSRAYALLPLHGGKAPRWLFDRMVSLASCIVEIIIHEFGRRGLLERLSDPWFFQSLSCVLGYDWHSSGSTTVTCGALKEALYLLNLGVAVAGGKGKSSRKAPEHIQDLGSRFGLSDERIKNMKYASKMAAKVDSSLVQDSYPIYHHSFIFDEDGDWIVIQQGLNEERRNARRYHWPLKHKGFINEPKNGIICDSRVQNVLDMTSSKSQGNRRACVDLIREDTRRLERYLRKPVKENQRTLDSWNGNGFGSTLVMPATINWKALRVAYDFQPKTYEELVSMPGIGSSTIRGLALVSELVYGEKPCWMDPVRFSFAFGGKDGVPFPVDRRAMDEAVDLLKTGIASSNIKREDKSRALQRLRKCVPPIPSSRLSIPKHYR